MSSKRFGFVLLPEFALLPLSCMVDTLEDANYVSERRLYDWCSLSVEGTEVMAANGLRVATDFDLRDAPPLDSVVCGQRQLDLPVATGPVSRSRRHDGGNGVGQRAGKGRA